MLTERQKKPPIGKEARVSLGVTRLEWMDAPVTPHTVADALAAAARPRDLGVPPPASARDAPLLTRAPVLAFVFVAHVALIAAAALAWRDSAHVGDFVEEIPVEIVIDGGPSRLEEPSAEAEKFAIAGEDPPPLAVMAEVAPLRAPEQPAPAAPEASAELAAEAPAGSSPAMADPQSTAKSDRETQAAEARFRAQRRAQERAALAAQQRAQEVAQERAEARARERAEERAEVERERRAQARRAAEREKQAQAAQERRRIAARSLASDTSRPSAASFDAAGYRSVVARAVSASTQSACSAGGGRVVVALMIGPSGRIASAALSSASGNSVLDSAALSAVRRAGPFPAPSNGATVSVPVVVVCR